MGGKQHFCRGWQGRILGCVPEWIARARGLMNALDREFPETYHRVRWTMRRLHEEVSLYLSRIATLHRLTNCVRVLLFGVRARITRPHNPLSMIRAIKDFRRIAGMIFQHEHKAGWKIFEKSLCKVRMSPETVSPQRVLGSWPEQSGFPVFLRKPGLVPRTPAGLFRGAESSRDSLVASLSGQRGPVEGESRVQRRRGASDVLRHVLSGGSSGLRD